MEAEAQSLNIFEVGRAPPPHHVGSSAQSKQPLRMVPGKTEVGCDGAGRGSGGLGLAAARLARLEAEALLAILSAEGTL